MRSIDIKSVTKCFGNTHALQDVSVSIDAGELFFLLGPSGCGKTTLLRTIAGFCSPDYGRVFFGGDDVTFLPPRRRNTGMVFQNYALWPHLTVADNVGFGLSVRKVRGALRARRVTEALEMVKMGGYEGRKPNQLSGGQQQRVALARALVIRPHCLLLDEPLSNLDAKLRLDMRAEIRTLCKEFGLTTVYVTHDQKEALSMADRIAVMQSGRITQLGPPTELYQRPRSAQVADFLGETNILKATIRSSRNGLRILDTDLGTLCASAPEGGRTSGPCLLSIRPETVDLLSATPESNGDTDNLLLATVRDRIYLGDTMQLILAT